MAKTTTAPATPPATATAQVTLGVRVVSFLATILEPKGVREQGELLNLLADVEEGKRPLADLQPFLQDVQFKAIHVRKRFDAADAAKLQAFEAKRAEELAKAKAPKQEGDQQEQQQD